MPNPRDLVHHSPVGSILRGSMPWPPMAQPRRKPASGGVRLPAMLTSFALLLPAQPVQAVAPAPQVCPNDMGAVPPAQALALKNAGQELRIAGSFQRASECFRLAVQELPDCATYADERLRWSLWAAENFERASPGADPELRAFLEHQVAQLGASPEGAALSDYAELVAARDRQRVAEVANPTPPATPPPRRATRVGAALMAGAAPLVITGGVLAGIYDARSDRLSGQLADLDQASKNDGCTSAPRPDEPGSCADHRRDRDRVHDDHLVTTRGFITGVALVGVGAGLLLAGLVTHLQGRRGERRTASLRLLPARNGLVLRGQF